MKRLLFTPCKIVMILICAWSCSDLGKQPKEVTQESVVILSAKDNTLYEDGAGLYSNGVGDHIFAGKNASGLIRRGLLAFDIAGSVPEGATIDSVTLTLNMSRTQAPVQTIELHRVLFDWGEGTSDSPFNEGGGTQSTAGDATWIHTFFDTSFWTNPGGDFSPTISGSQLVDTNGSYTWESTSQMVADVQAWLDAPSQDYGWILVGNEAGAKTAKRFDTRENPTESNRPVLKVYYTMSIV